MEIGAACNDEDVVSMESSFNNYLVSQSNEFAYLCTKKFVENIISGKQDEAFRSLCISGKFGVGKTHLLLSIRDELAKSKPACKVLSIDISQFFSMFIASIRNDQISQFEESFADYDVYLIEDIHHVWGKEATSEELCRLLKKVLSLDKKVAITYNPEVSEDFEKNIYNKHLMDLISSSLHAAIGPPDNELLDRYFCNNTADAQIEMTETIKEAINECENFYGVIGLVKQFTIKG